MSGGADGPSADDAARARREERRRAASKRSRSAAGGVGAAWRALTADQKLAAVAAIALLLSMLLPWYQETGFVNVKGRVQPLDDSKNAFQVYSFVEAAVFVVSAGVLALLFARGRRRAFHLPGGDGAVIMARACGSCSSSSTASSTSPTAGARAWSTSRSASNGASSSRSCSARCSPTPATASAPTTHPSRSPTTSRRGPRRPTPAPTPAGPADWLAEDDTTVAQRPARAAARGRADRRRARRRRAGRVSPAARRT
jgi:hypothetical protein